MNGDVLGVSTLVLRDLEALAWLLRCYFNGVLSCKTLLGIRSSPAFGPTPRSTAYGRKFYERGARPATVGLGARRALHVVASDRVARFPEWRSPVLTDTGYECCDDWPC